MSPIWRERLTTAVICLLILVAYGIVGRWDYEDARIAEEAARQVRSLVAAAGWCGPKPGQISLQEWDEGRLRCTIKENTGYGRAPRIVARLEGPALSHSTAGE